MGFSRQGDTPQPSPRSDPAHARESALTSNLFISRADKSLRIRESAPLPAEIFHGSFRFPYLAGGLACKPDAVSFGLKYKVSGRVEHLEPYK
jgi:hypothetical protein